MFVAVDESGNRIFADKSLPKDVPYFCPICKGKVRLRAGNTNIEHFSHINACTDDFTYDMSEWHRKWQALFPKNNREIVIPYNGETHRADVLCYGTVIEFQHSSISESEFFKRNNFYTSAGYKVLWIFDVIDLYTDQPNNKGITLIAEWNNFWGSGGIFKWSPPWRFLKNFMPQDEKNIDVFFNIIPLGDNPKSQEAVACIEKVEWVNPNYKTLWGNFHTSYKVCNYHELLNWLFKRYHDSKKIATNNAKNKKDYSYLVDGQVIEPLEFETFLKEHEPYHILQDGQSNSQYATGQFGKHAFFCPNSHQKPRIQSDICYLGCCNCFAIEEISKKERYIYCKPSRPKGVKYNVVVFKKIRKT